jgi:superfamily II DNA/RNA helicase
LPNEIWCEILGMVLLWQLRGGVPPPDPGRCWANFNGRDVIIQAQSGTGKTAAYAVGVLQQVVEHVHECQALVLCPPNLVNAVATLLEQIAGFMRVDVVAVGGGAGSAGGWAAIAADGEQHPKIESQVVVGTPRAVLELIRRNAGDPQASTACASA